MFSGIVEALGRIMRVDVEGEGRRFAIGWPAAGMDEAFVMGESIAVNGCCLTVVASPEAGVFEAQAGPETLLRTNLGSRGTGDAVNLERSMRINDRLGGHFVQGHVDGTAQIVDRRTVDEWEFLRFRLDDPRWTELMVEKGSVAVDGVSLTIVDVDADSFSVMLIPHTLGATTLGTYGVGDRVNIETDMLAKHVAKLVGSGRLREAIGAGASV
jgi:riboflavin synthase